MFYTCKKYVPGNGKGDGAENGTSPANAWHVKPSWIPDWMITWVCLMLFLAASYKVISKSNTIPQIYALVWTPNTSSVPLAAQTFRVYSGQVVFTNHITQWGLPIQLVDYARLMEFTNWPCVATVTGANCYYFQSAQRSQFFAVKDQWNQWATSK